ncbi:uncharacterized protein RAG0_10806 [Rhynchosporium agropyri]|uniref:Uncharacterized protein n=1 Tax=Rhynchosporium agropyri TaxID=914238 RepID=A0A1E1L1B3_9HELO|nr:uncharacterized protein RAG0_10806 [Rhynchosporium agropyri]
MCFQISTTFSCGHKVVTKTICHYHRSDYLKGIEVKYCDDFIDTPMKEDFVCDQCRREKPVVISHDKELPRLERDEEEEKEEEVEEVEEKPEVEESNTQETERKAVS